MPDDTQESKRKAEFYRDQRLTDEAQVSANTSRSGAAAAELKHIEGKLGPGQRQKLESQRTKFGETGTGENQLTTADQAFDLALGATGYPGEKEVTGMALNAAGKAIKPAAKFLGAKALEGAHGLGAMLKGFLEGKAAHEATQQAERRAQDPASMAERAEYAKRVKSVQQKVKDGPLEQLPSSGKYKLKGKTPGEPSVTGIRRSGSTTVGEKSATTAKPTPRGPEYVRPHSAPKVIEDEKTPTGIIEDEHTPTGIIEDENTPLARPVSKPKPKADAKPKTESKPATAKKPTKAAAEKKPRAPRKPKPKAAEPAKRKPFKSAKSELNKSKLPPEPRKSDRVVSPGKDAKVTVKKPAEPKSASKPKKAPAPAEKPVTKADRLKEKLKQDMREKGKLKPTEPAKPAGPKKATEDSGKQSFYKRGATGRMIEAKDRLDDRLDAKLKKIKAERPDLTPEQRLAEVAKGNKRAADILDNVKRQAARDAEYAAKQKRLKDKPKGRGSSVTKDAYKTLEGNQILTSKQAFGDHRVSVSKHKKPGRKKK